MLLAAVRFAPLGKFETILFIMKVDNINVPRLFNCFFIKHLGSSYISNPVLRFGAGAFRSGSLFSGGFRIMSAITSAIRRGALCFA